MPQPTQRRRDGRPVETVPAGATTMPPPAPQGTGAQGVTPAIAGGLAAPAAMGAPVAVAGLPTTAAVSLSSAAILQGFERFLDGRARVIESQVDLLLEQEYGTQVDEATRLDAIDEELRNEQAYRAKVRARLDRDLPKVLAISDASVREVELRKVLDRERRIAESREEAIAVRSLGAMEARLVRASSPQGAYWKLSPHVREHTLDCLAMGGKVWPWTVLEAYRPPLHVGCACELVGIGDAQRQELPGSNLVAHPEQAFGAMAVQEAAFDAVDLTEEIELLELRVLEAWDQRWGHGTTKGGQFRPKRGGAPGRPTGLRVLGRRSRGLELLHAAERASRGVPAQGDGTPTLTRKRGADVQTGDHVAVGGEWHRVQWTNHDRAAGYVELEGHGPVLLDPHKEFDVRVHDAVAEPGGRGGGEHRPPVHAGVETSKSIEHVRPGDRFTHTRTVGGQDFVSTHEVIGAPAVHPRTGKVEVRTLTIGGGRGDLREHAFEPGTQVTVHPEGHLPTPKGLEAVDQQKLASFHHAVREETLASHRRLALSNIRSVTPERARYDWRKGLTELGVQHDLSQEHHDRLLAANRTATAERLKAQTAVYRDLVEKGIAYDVEDHSHRLKDKPFEVRPRPETLGVIGGEQFARESGASLRLARYKSRENAQKVVDELHARESQRLREADHAAPSGDVHFRPADHAPGEMRVKLRAEIARHGEGETRLPGGVRIVSGSRLESLSHGSQADLRRPYRVHFPGGHVDVEGTDGAAMEALHRSAQSEHPESIGGSTRHGDYREPFVTDAQRAAGAPHGELVGFAPGADPVFGRRDRQGRVQTWAAKQVDAEGNVTDPKGAIDDLRRLPAGEEKPPPAPEGPNYGGEHGLPELKRWPDDARFELRYGDNASLVMWDRQEKKPYAVWESDYDVGALTKAVDESNIAAAGSSAASTPEHAPNPDRPTREQIDGLSKMKEPGEATQLAPGIRYDPAVTRATEDEHGLTVGPGFFKMRDRRLKQQVIFRHLGRDLSRGLSSDEMDRLGDLRNIDALYHGLNDEKAYKRVEAIEPEKAAVLAEAARRLGLPLHPKVDEWLGQRGAEPEHSLARGGGEPDRPEMVDAKALANAIVGERTAHFTLPQKGYLMAGGEKVDLPTGFAYKSMTFHHPEHGIDVHVELEDGAVTKATARPNTGPLPDDLAPRMSGDTLALTSLSEEGWDWTALGGGRTSAGDGYHRLVHPDGRGVIVYEQANGELRGARSYTPTPEAVANAKNRAIGALPQQFLDPGREWDEALGAHLSRAGWGGSLQGRGIRNGDTIDVDPKTGAPATRLTARLPEGVDEVRIAKRNGQTLTVHLKDNKIVAAGYGHPDPTAAPLQSQALTSIVSKDVHDTMLEGRQARIDAAKQRAEAEAGSSATALLDFAKANAAKKAGKKVTAPDDLVRSLTTNGDGSHRTVSDVVRHLKGAGWDLADARRGKAGGRRVVNYRLRGPDGSTVELRGGNTFGDQSVDRVVVIPSPQGGERKRHPAGVAWKNADELYADALGRADEQAARHNGVAHVTSVYDGPVGRALAHHEWNGAIVMGVKSKARQRIDDYLKKLDAGEPLTDPEHVGFYDVLSTLQHEIHHGVGAAGNEEGGLAFGSRHYNHNRPWEIAMEEALTEETARLETLNWLRAQGMTSTLEAVKRMSKTDHRYLGSYSAYRAKLGGVLDAAGVPESDRKALLYRMKFEMTPDERMHHLDAAIAQRDPVHRSRMEKMPHRPGAQGHAAGYSPTKVLMGGNTRNFGGRGPAEFRPVIDDPLDDVRLTARAGDQTSVGDTVEVIGWTGKPQTGKVLDPNAPDDRIRVEISGTAFSIAKGNVLSVTKNDGAKVSPPAGVSAAHLPDGLPVGIGSEVMVTSGDEKIRGEITDVNKDYALVRRDDGLELWTSLDRLSAPGKANLTEAATA